MFHSVGIVGCGLIGGSLALAIKKTWPTIKIYGINRRLDDIKKDKKSSCFELLGTSVDELPKDVDIVFVCTPIETTVSIVYSVAKHVKKETIITDVASVKEQIENGVNQLSIDLCFIPGHPMAGKETTRFNVAEATLFEDAPYFLVPQTGHSYKALKLFIAELGCKIIELDAKKHDELVACTSHVPFLVASALTRSAINSIELELVKQSYGPGFKDSTRVASSAPNWGVDVCKHNKSAVLNGITAVITYLETIKEAIRCEDQTKLLDFFETSKRQRDQLKRD